MGALHADVSFSRMRTPRAKTRNCVFNKHSWLVRHLVIQTEKNWGPERDMDLLSHRASCVARPKQNPSFFPSFLHKYIHSALTIPDCMLRIYQREDLLTRCSQSASKKTANRFFKTQWSDVQGSAGAQGRVVNPGKGQYQGRLPGGDDNPSRTLKES